MPRDLAEFRPYRIKFNHEASGKDLLIDLGSMVWSDDMLMELTWLPPIQYSFAAQVEAQTVVDYLNSVNNPAFKGTFSISLPAESLHLQTNLTSTQV